jgi:hypothetical protein
MNLTDHAAVRLAHGKPKVNSVEIHHAIGGAGARHGDVTRALAA